MFIFVILSILLYGVRADFTSWPDRERDLGASAFPSPVADAFSVPADAALAADIRKRLNDAVDVIRLRPLGWFSVVLPKRAITSAELERVLKGAPGIPVRVCKGDCRPCGSAVNACLAAKLVGEETGTHLFIRACALSSRGCPSSIASMPGPRFVLQEFLEQTLGVFAHYKLEGPSGRDRAERNARAGATHLRETASAVNGLLSRCPGPYTERDLKFLSGAGHATANTPYSDECGDAYLKALRATVPTCPPDRARIAESVRCDEYCQSMLCMKAGAAPQLREVGGRRVLLIRTKSCEGAMPTAIAEFLRGESRAWSRSCAK